MQAKFVTLASLLMLAGGTVAKPVHGLEKRQFDGFQILADHVKYVSNPPSALQPIPAGQNSPAREAHRNAHAALAGGAAAANGGGAASANPLGGLFGGLFGGNANTLGSHLGGFFGGGNAAGGNAAGGSAADGSAAGDSTDGGNVSSGSIAGSNSTSDN